MKWEQSVDLIGDFVQNGGGFTQLHLTTDGTLIAIVVNEGLLTYDGKKWVKHLSYGSRNDGTQYNNHFGHGFVEYPQGVFWLALPSESKVSHLRQLRRRRLATPAPQPHFLLLQSGAGAAAPTTAASTPGTATAKAPLLSSRPDRETKTLPKPRLSRTIRAQFNAGVVQW